MNKKANSFKITPQDTKMQLKAAPAKPANNTQPSSSEPQRQVKLRSSINLNESSALSKLGHHKLPDFSKSTSQVTPPLPKSSQPSNSPIQSSNLPTQTPQSPLSDPQTPQPDNSPNQSQQSSNPPSQALQITQPDNASTQTPQSPSNSSNQVQQSSPPQQIPSPTSTSTPAPLPAPLDKSSSSLSSEDSRVSLTSSQLAVLTEVPEVTRRIERNPTIWEGGKEEEWNICTVGSQCGKSALVVRFLYDKFADIDEPTVEDHHKREGSTFYVEGIRTTLKILDTSGSDDYASFRHEWFSRSQGFIFVFSVNSQTSFDLLPTFFTAVTNAKQTDKFPMVLVATQLDTVTPEKRAVSRKSGRDLARKYNCPYWECSSKTGQNIDEVFKSIVDELRYGKKKDPFIQEHPYYKTTWKELIQNPLASEEYLINVSIPAYNYEIGTSPAINSYVFPHNTQDDRATPEIITSVFEQTLQECMEKQKDRMPELPVPRILMHLIDAFYAMDGPATEGVFRVPPFPNEVKQLREQLNLGNYHLFSIATNVHTITALIKLWLRELTEPLIPNSFYETCVSKPDKASDVFKRLPELNQRVVTCILNFLEDLIQPAYVEKTKMNKENLALVFAPSFLRCPYTDPVAIMASSESEKHFVLELWNVVPPPEKRKVALFPYTLVFEREEKYIPYYQDYFASEKDQFSFIGRDTTSPLFGGIAMNPIRDEWRTLIITKENKFRFFIQACKEKDLLDKLRTLAGDKDKVPGISKLKKPKNQKNFIKDLVAFEKNEIANTYKWGVLYFKEGQDEDAMYANATPSAAFEDFLNFLGTRIVLKGFTGFRGGLDVKNNSTGTHSIYHNFHDMEIMFHVATLLPSYPNDKQQLERKRHLGNDVVIIIFKEATSKFSPTMLKSEFNHIFVVVSEAGPNHYRIQIACKDGVPPFGPPLPHPGVFPKGNALREFLFTKLINGERAALHGCPNFKNKLIAARRVQLEELEKNYGKKK